MTTAAQTKDPPVACKGPTWYGWKDQVAKRTFECYKKNTLYYAPAPGGYCPGPLSNKNNKKCILPSNNKEAYWKDYGKPAPEIDMNTAKNADETANHIITICNDALTLYIITSDTKKKLDGVIDNAKTITDTTTGILAYATNNKTDSIATINNKIGDTLKETETLLKTAKQYYSDAETEDKKYNNYIKLIADINNRNATIDTFEKSQQLADAKSNLIKFMEKIRQKETNKETKVSSLIQKYSTPDGTMYGNIAINTMLLDETSSAMNSINTNKDSEYKLINFKIEAAKSYPMKCSGSSENASSSMNMSLLDNNLHTKQSCKVNSTIQKKPYYALVKPQNSSTDKFNCYVSNDINSASSNVYDYVNIWEYPSTNNGQSVSDLVMDNNGDLIINYANGNSDNITRNIDTFSPSFCTNYGATGCTFYLELLDNGNMKLHRITNSQSGPADLVIWQLFSYETVKTNITNISNYGPITNEQWSSAPDSKNKLTPGNRITSSNVLISPGRTCKLEVQNGRLQLKATIYGCKYSGIMSDTTLFNNNKFMYTMDSGNTNQPFYVYQNDLQMPSIQQLYYATNAYGYRTLQAIDPNNPIIQRTNTYDTYSGYGRSNDVNSDGITALDCKELCNADDNCDYVYKENDKCIKGNANISNFVPNNSSTLYIRNKKMNTENSNINGIVNNYSSFDDSTVSYSKYNVDNTMNGNSFTPGPHTLLLWQNINARQKEIIGNTTTGNITTGNTITGNTITEGFDSHNYYNPIQQCDTRNAQGCHNAILQGQINPLNNIAQDYQNQTTQLNTTRANIQTALNQYQSTYNIVNNDVKYDFSGNQPFNMEDTSIQNVMQQDTKQLLLQENNFYIAGSILTTTLLITAIYLAR